MSELLYKTIANESPQGKANVYFACHPDDLEAYFDEYASEILKIKDCAVWYDPGTDSSYDPDDLEQRISQMQLLMIPVTTRLLTSPNRAMDIEFPLALKYRIPVLPLMMERGLDDIFSKRFGDLQYLDPNDTDETKRGFDEVFSSYIRATLVSDEMAKKVRAAFDAYIFLSYRKKDRKKAQELMRLIHRDPLCRDIAIWYDEFLTPGEDFNQAIEEMLKKSDLFALAVTPNLVNEVNYVMTTEYPVALDNGKPVLPVEMAETDRKALEEHYRSLPACVQGKDGEAFRKALQEKLKKIAVASGKDDPEHDLLIGLAYLDGIDVEVDSKRALELISSSAESGLPEAMSQLVTMYETGKGVERDLFEGERWRERLVSKLRDVCEADPADENARRLINALWDLGNAQYALGLNKEASATYEEMLARSDRAASGDNDFLRLSSVADIMLGDLARERGNLSAARKYYENAVDKGTKLAQKTGAAEVRRDLFISYTGLGNIAKAMGDLRAAQSYYEKGLKTIEALYKEKGTASLRRSLSVSYVNMGDNAEAKEDLSTAREYYEKALDICTELAESTDTALSRRDLASIHSRLGNVSMALGEHSRAKDHYDLSLEICEALAADNGTIQSLRDVSAICEDLGDLEKARGELPLARVYYERSLEIRRDLAEKTDTVLSRRDLANVSDGLGDIAASEGDLSSAQDYYDAALEIRKGLSKDTNTPDSRRDLAVSYNRAGDIAKERNDFKTAKRYYRDALEICRDLVIDTGSPSYRGDMSVIYSRLGEISESEGDLSTAQRYYERALEISESLAKVYGTLRSRSSLSMDYNKLGSVALARGDDKTAKEYYEKGLAIREELTEEIGTVQSRRDLSVSYNKLAEICISLGELSKAGEYYEKCLGLRSTIAAETSAPQYVWDLAVIYYNLGLFYFSQIHDKAKSKEMFCQLVDIRSAYNDPKLENLKLETKDIIEKHF